MKTKTTVGYQFILIRMAIIKKAKGKCWQRCEEKRILSHSRDYKFILPPLSRIVWRVLKTLKLELSWSSSFTTGYTCKGNQISTARRHLLSCLLSTIHNGPQMEASQVFINEEWVEEMWYVFTYNRMLFSYKRMKSCYLWQYRWNQSSLY